MSIQIADTLYETETSAVRDACHSWLYADGLNDNAYVLATLKNVPHQDIADEVVEWLAPADFDPCRDMILAELAALQQALEQAEALHVAKLMCAEFQFHDWALAQNLEFPCTAGEYIARAKQFAAGDEEIVDVLCSQGIGSDWRERLHD